jgi:hypothetical protein
VRGRLTRGVAQAAQLQGIGVSAAAVANETDALNAQLQTLLVTKATAEALHAQLQARSDALSDRSVQRERRRAVSGPPAPAIAAAPSAPESRAQEAVKEIEDAIARREALTAAIEATRASLINGASDVRRALPVPLPQLVLTCSPDCCPTAGRAATARAYAARLRNMRAGIVAGHGE